VETVDTLPSLLRQQKKISTLGLKYQAVKKAHLKQRYRNSIWVIKSQLHKFPVTLSFPRINNKKLSGLPVVLV